jgi:hypothetical protein
LRGELWNLNRGTKFPYFVARGGKKGIRPSVFPYCRFNALRKGEKGEIAEKTFPYGQQRAAGEDNKGKRVPLFIYR